MKNSVERKIHKRNHHRHYLREDQSYPSYTGESHIPTNIQFVRYGGEEFYEQKITNLHNIKEQIHEDKVNWIRVSGLNSSELIIDLVKDFGLNLLDAKDVLTPQHIVSIDEFDHNVFVVLTAVYYKPDKELVNEHMAFILGENYLISFQETEEPIFDGIYNAIKSHSVRMCNRKADFLLASMLYEIFGNYEDVLSSFKDDLELLEDVLLDISQINRNMITDIQEKRRGLISFRKILLPYKDQFPKLLRLDNNLIDAKTLPFYRDLSDQMLFALQNIESCREIMSSLVDLYLNNNDLKMDVSMQRLTVVATIFIPLTFLVGVWGMNFKFMPELEWEYGYLFAWVVMLLSGVILWLILKKKGWF